MTPTASLSVSEARKAASELDALIEERVDLALTPDVLTRLALKGVTEEAARNHLRKCAANALLAEYGRN